MLFPTEFHLAAVGDDGRFTVEGRYLQSVKAVLFHEGRQKEEKQEIEAAAEISVSKKNRRTA